jgi:DNA-binding winged helix-turn-helix (wHTH) protein/tetratricopeptide (TPR) repeat protein
MASREYRFGAFRLDTGKRELWRDATEVPLQLKVFDCLAYLVEHRDRAVGRDELIGWVWGRADVTDNVLGQIIGRARHAVGDNGEDQRVIRTVLRFGYRWVAPVEVSDTAPPENDAPDAAVTAGAPTNDTSAVERATTAVAHAPAPAAPASPAIACADAAPAAPASPAIACADAAPIATASPVRRRWTRHAGVLVAGVLVAAMLLVAMTWGARHARDSAVSASAASVAVVLPVIVDAGGSNTWIRLGVMDLIAERLREAGQPVTPSDSVVALARGFVAPTPTAAEITSIAEITGAAWVFGARAELARGRWQVSLHNLHGRPVSAQAEDVDVLAAARAAADRLLAEIGLEPPDAAVARDAGLATLVQRARAAILANQLEEARAVLDGAGDRGARPEVRYQRAQIELIAGRFEPARAAFAALADSLTGGEPIPRGEALYGLGVSFMRQSRYDEADRALGDAVGLLDGRHEPRARAVLGRVLNVRGGTRMEQHRFDLARADLARARVTLDSVGDAVALGSVDNNFGALFTYRGRDADALPFFERAAERARAMRDVATEIRARSNLAEARLAVLDPAAALAGDERIRQLIAKVTDPRLRQFASCQRVLVLFANGRLREARDEVRQLRAKTEELVDPAMRSFVEGVAAEVAEDDDAAATAARASLAATSDQQPKYARAWLILVRAELRAGRFDAAGTLASDATAWAERIGEPDAAIYAALARAEHTAAVRPAAGAAAFERALALADASGVPFHILQVAASYADYLIAAGDVTTLTVIAGRVAAWAERDYRAALVQLQLYHVTGDTAAWRSALQRVEALAGEMPIPSAVSAPPR